MDHRDSLMISYSSKPHKRMVHNDVQEEHLNKYKMTQKAIVT